MWHDHIELVLRELFHLISIRELCQTNVVILRGLPFDRAQLDAVTHLGRGRRLVIDDQRATRQIQQIRPDEIFKWPDKMFSVWLNKGDGLSLLGFVVKLDAGDGLPFVGWVSQDEIEKYLERFGKDFMEKFEEFLEPRESIQNWLDVSK